MAVAVSPFRAVEHLEVGVAVERRRCEPILHLPTPPSTRRSSPTTGSKKYRRLSAATVGIGHLRRARSGEKPIQPCGGIGISDAITACSRVMTGSARSGLVNASRRLMRRHVGSTCGALGRSATGEESGERRLDRTRASALGPVYTWRSSSDASEHSTSERHVGQEDRGVETEKMMEEEEVEEEAARRRGVGGRCESGVHARLGLAENGLNEEFVAMACATTKVAAMLACAGLVMAAGGAEAAFPPRKVERRHMRRREDMADKEGGGRKNGKQGDEDRSKRRWNSEKKAILIVDKERMTFTVDFLEAKKRVTGAFDRGKEAIGRVDAREVVENVNLRGLMESTAGRLKEVKRSTGIAVRKYQRKAEKLVQPLRSGVVIRPDGRIVVRTRGEQIKAFGVVLFGSVMAIIVVRWLILTARRNKWGWEDWYDESKSSSVKLVRDRSLGGREVVVGDGGLWETLRARWNGLRGISAANDRESRSRSRSFSPLDEAIDRANARSEKVLLRDLNARRSGSSGSNGRRKENRMPQWWPSSPEVPPRLSPEKQERWRVEAQNLLTNMLDARLAGQDFRNSDLLELRRLCRSYGVSVTVETTNTRESLFRSAVSFALSACSSGSENLSLAPDRPSSFVAGMAHHVGVELERAAVIVNAAVAARTRSGFMQAWARKKQERQEEAEKDLRALVQIHKEFLPEKNSPELELVARGLETRIAFSERHELFMMYVSVGGKELEIVAAESLGLDISPAALE